MTSYIIRRVLWLIPVLFLVSIVTFGLMHIAPGGPWDRDPSQKQLPQRTIDRLNAQFNLDKPLEQQYLLYMWGAIRGDLGPSYQRPSQNVTSIIVERIPYSARLGLQATLLAFILGLILGVTSALKHNSWLDYVALFFATIGAAVPSFVLGIVLIMIFAVGFNMFPVAATDWDSWNSWVLPTITLAAAPMAYLTRLTRSAVLEVMNQEYVLTARAKGLRSRRVITGHVLKNAMIPVWTVIGPILAGLTTGSFVTETVFSIPGVGRFFVAAISQRDYSMIMGSTLFYALVIAVANLLVDVSYPLFDPRIRLGH